MRSAFRDEGISAVAIETRTRYDAGPLAAARKKTSGMIIAPMIHEDRSRLTVDAMEAAAEDSARALVAAMIAIESGATNAPWRSP